MPATGFPAQTTYLSYDYESRVSGITYPSSATNSFKYNGSDLRVQKVDSGGTHNYITDGTTPASAVISDGSAVYTPGLSENRGGTSAFYHPDALGSTRDITNSSQSVTDTRRFDAFGMLMQTSGSNPTAFGFAGAEQYQTDSDSGLMLLGHRYYDNTTGRFLSRDPAYAGTNWYAYCGNNPVLRADPSGLEDVKLDGESYHRHIGDPDIVKGWPHWDGPRGKWIGNDGLVRDKDGNTGRVGKATQGQIDRQIDKARAQGLGEKLTRPKGSPAPPFEPPPPPPEPNPADHCIILSEPVAPYQPGGAGSATGGGILLGVLCGIVIIGGVSTGDPVQVIGGLAGLKRAFGM